MVQCFYLNRKLPLLQASCVCTTVQTIAVVIPNTPGFDEETKISTSLPLLGQRFGMFSGFVNEPEVQYIRYGSNTSSTSGAA